MHARGDVEAQKRAQHARTYVRCTHAVSGHSSATGWSSRERICRVRVRVGMCVGAVARSCDRER